MTAVHLRGQMNASEAVSWPTPLSMTSLHRRGDLNQKYPEVGFREPFLFLVLGIYLSLCHFAIYDLLYVVPNSLMK